MLSRKTSLAAVTTLALGAGVASAQVHIGEPITVPAGLPRVSVHYMSATTPYDGVLWLAAASSPTGFDMPLFFNHDGALGFEHDLGLYAPGDRLDVIYDVLTGMPDSFRTDDPLEIFQFRWEWDTPDIILVEVDDVRLPLGDADYDDIRFEVRFQQIPGPTAAGALGLLGVLNSRRRRS